jgi:CRP/FNR family cyclic AMP-dependent transcriptional regulator
VTAVTLPVSRPSQAYDLRVQWRILVGVPETELQHLIAVARRRRFARREVVFHDDDPADSLHLVVKGRFAVRLTTAVGDAVTVAVRGRGDAFGELALLGGGARRAATVVALEEGETLALQKPDFDRLRAQYPAINEVLLASLARELRATNERLLEALYVSSERRVLRRLKELTDAVPAPDGRVEVPLTQAELAGLAGTSRATVNRVLRQEERRGTVALERGRTVVLDRASVARRAR